MMDSQPQAKINPQTNTPASAPDVSVVVPVYNSASCLPELVERLDKLFRDWGKTREIILVNDDSKDVSWEVIVNLTEKYDGVMGLHLLKNSGQTVATMGGIKHASGRVVVTMDDDLQHDPASIPTLVEELERGDWDCVFAAFPRKQHEAWRNLASRLLSRLSAEAMGGGKSISVSSFRVMRRCVADVLANNDSQTATVGGAIFSATPRVTSVPVPHHERYAGKSNYNVRKQIKLALDYLCSVSTLPLRLISFAGIGAALLSGGLLVFYLIKYFMGGITVPGWTTVVILISFFSGLILLSLGVIGEYLVRVLRELQRPKDIPTRAIIGGRGSHKRDQTARPGGHL